MAAQGGAAAAIGAEMKRLKRVSSLVDYKECPLLSATYRHSLPQLRDRSWRPIRRWRSKRLFDFIDLAPALIERSDGRISDIFCPACVVDWKTDVSPTAQQINLYREQMRDYLVATGAPEGLLLFVTTGQLVRVRPTFLLPFAAANAA